MPQRSEADSMHVEAQSLDDSDALSPFRSRFHIPKNDSGRPIVYLTGNSLGLQPKSAAAGVNEVLRAWAERGVAGHFHGENAWLGYARTATRQMAGLVGAETAEVALLNALSVNIHLLLASFYRPEGKRRLILMESEAFPSDRYAVESHLRLRDLDPESGILRVGPRDGEHLIRTEDIATVLERRGDEIALVFLGGLNYYTGQLLDLESLTRLAHEAGCTVGFDLAHAAGNVALRLHDWNVDFAAWCTYKYLNGGPGAPGGLFVHHRHHGRPGVPMLRGWWGQPVEDRFLMLDGFVPADGAAAFHVSNPSIFALAPLKASLALIEEAGFDAMLEKSRRLTTFLAAHMRDRLGDRISILTPSDPASRGAQLSVLVPDGRPVFDALKRMDISCDWREPNVLRMAPAPLYNSFVDAAHAVDRLAAALNGDRFVPTAQEPLGSSA